MSEMNRESKKKRLPLHSQRSQEPTRPSTVHTHTRSPPALRGGRAPGESQQSRVASGHRPEPLALLRVLEVFRVTGRRTVRCAGRPAESRRDSKA